jgi:hypothetical protein
VQTAKGGCTFNYVFVGSDLQRYIGTAGHCILGDSRFSGEDVGVHTWSGFTGPWARDADGREIGRFAFAILTPTYDFALIRIHSDVPASPKMCHFGGPIGGNSDRTDATVELKHYGNGIGVGDVLPARTAWAFGMSDRDTVYATGAAVPGDSGSAVNSADGRAVGVLVAISDSIIITRLQPQVGLAQRAMGMSLALQTAPTA